MNINMSKYDIISLEEIELYANDLVENEIAVLRKNKEGAWVDVPLSNLKQVIGREKGLGSKTIFYIQKGWEEEIESKKKYNNKVDTYSTEKEEANVSANKENIKKQMDKFGLMTPEERAEKLNEHETGLKNIISKSNFDEEATETILEASTDTTLISKVSMLETMDRIKSKVISEAEAKNETDDITKKSQEVVRLIVQILKQNRGTQESLSRLKDNSEGTTISHSNRVFIRFVNFILYYNDFINKGLVSRLRTKFKDKYLKYYKTLLPKKDVHSIEEIIEKGMSRVDDEKLLIYSIGALLHDIGKVEDIEYYESGDTRDFNRIKNHVYNSYYLMMRTSELPHAVSLIAAYHHEYYNHESGYGLYRELKDLRKRSGPIEDAEFAISYEEKSVERFIALSFFPAKAIEVLDVYDALTDPARKYYNKKVYAPYEALGIMKEDFIEKNLKLDPILFDIFIDYLSAEDEGDYSKQKIIESFF